MDAIECIKQRRSVRIYIDKSIPKDILADMIDCARLAPSGRNTQGWDFVVVTDREMLKKIADLTDHGKFAVNAGACIIVVSKDTTYFMEDGAAATQNILLAATAHGIGSCWLAGDKKYYDKDMLKLFGVPKDHRLVSIIVLGYCENFPSPPNKRELDDVLHWEKF